MNTRNTRAFREYAQILNRLVLYVDDSILFILRNFLYSLHVASEADPNYYISQPMQARLDYINYYISHWTHPVRVRDLSLIHI